MISIDGKTTDLHVANFGNLEEILVKAVQEKELENRIVTDVFVNDEAFSEIYPHQAEDIDVSEISSVEIRSVSADEMAADVTDELYKVITLMNNGGKRVAALLRQADLSEGLEVFQDVLEVTRNFLGTVSVLRSTYAAADDSEIVNLTENIAAVLEEMSEVMGNEDWLLLADLLEYEFLPACSAWDEVLNRLAGAIACVKAA